MIFKNDHENLIVRYEFDINKLPKKNLITTMCIKGIQYGFYNNIQDLDFSSSYLFMGRSLEITPEFTPQFKLLRQFMSHSGSQVKLTRYFFSNDSLVERIRTHFNSSSDSKIKVKCLFHDDRNPSMSIDFEKACFYCFSCKTGGSFAKLISRINDK